MGELIGDVGGFVRSSTVFRDHLDSAERNGPRPYSGLEAFTHPSTDGPSLRTVARSFPDVVIKADKRSMHALPPPLHGFSGEGRLGLHQWSTLEARCTEGALRRPPRTPEVGLR